MWLIDKIRESVENIPYEENRVSGGNVDSPARNSLSKKLHSNVLTPDKIPDFFIPPQLSKNTDNVDGLSSKWQVNYFGSENNINNLTKIPALHTQSDKHSQSHEGGQGARLANQHVIQIESAEDIAALHRRNTNNTKKASHVTCLSSSFLPHTGPYYGLTGLFETPNTRRKESLFHVDCTSYTLHRKEYAVSNKQCVAPVSVGQTSSSSFKMFPKQGTTESEPTSSTEPSPHSSPLLPRSISGTSLFKLFSQESPSNDISRSASKQSLGGNSSFSTDESSSADASPSASKKAGFPVKTPSLGCCLSPPVLFPLDLLHCQERLQREHVIPLQGRGRVRLSAEYDLGSVTVRVRVVSVEELYDSTFEVKHIHCCVIVCLMPGKQQKQYGTIIKNSKNPIFNEDFFFDSMPEQALQSMSLRIKVINKASSLKRDTVLGVISRPLSQLLLL
ncbi:C2 calcium-dependent domain-containing protein 4C-like [Amia ocellicauda]|uniref:C2 calcium-dependent domain-containing protein 4C-like n=1 Tax=Amia ocellicauda TaxID=2972642 RepID=UPI003464A96A|nr:C2C4C protein [Amia calva]